MRAILVIMLASILSIPVFKHDGNLLGHNQLTASLNDTAGRQ